jgi:hypothetical protein
VSEDRDGSRPDDRAARGTRLEDLAGSLGLDPPIFEGPLTAFVPERDAGGPIFFGGDLHAVHPDATGPRPPERRDRSLDAAKIVVYHPERSSQETGAVEGVWCLALPDELRDSRPYFVLRDSEDRLRAWLWLPAPPTMIGIGHFWLPRVEPLPDPSPGATSSVRDRRGPTS